MAWTLDTFDTSLLGIPSYKSDIPAPISRKGFYSCFVPVKPQLLSKLEAYGFRLMSVRNTYVFDRPVTRQTTAAVEVFNPKQKLTDEELKELGRPIWEHSRYHADDRIPNAKSLALYRTWVENSLLHGYADQCFVAFSGKRIVGLCTVKIKNDDGYIDLLGVLPAYQGKGLGMQLLTAGVNYLNSKSVRKIYVVTEGENVPANRLYQTFGFLLNRTELAYHAHI